MRAFKTLTAAVALLAFAGTAQADMKTTGKWGSWITMAGTARDTGNPMCEVGTTGQDRAFFIKVSKSTHVVYRVQVYKQGWAIPDDQPVDVVLQVDNAPAMTFNGEGMAAGKSVWSGISIEIEPDAQWAATGKSMGSELLSLLSDGVDIKFTFPQGSEKSWIGSLTGSRPAIGTFTGCVMAMLGGGSPTATTQPFVTKSTQPF